MSISVLICAFDDSSLWLDRDELANSMTTVVTAADK